MVRAGLEPGISGSQGKRPNHWATLPPQLLFQTKNLNVVRKLPFTKHSFVISRKRNEQRRLFTDWDGDEYSILMFPKTCFASVFMCRQPSTAEETHIIFEQNLYPSDGEFAVCDSLQCICSPRTYFFILQKC